MTGEEVRAALKLAEAATAGPWEVMPKLCGPDGQGVYTMDPPSEGGKVCEVGDPYPRGGNNPQESMEFIAAARTLVPALATELLKTRELLRETKDLLLVMTSGYRFGCTKTDLINRVNASLEG